MPNLLREAPTAQRAEDAWLGPVLVATWALRTGRTLRRDLPCSALSADELIAFWADPLLDAPPPSDQLARTWRIIAR